MASIFRSVKRARLRRNKVNLSHQLKLTTDFGRLTPIYSKLVVPGDTFKLRTEMLVRMAPLLSPVMNNVNVYTHFFFVPMRLVEKNFKTFITGGEKGDGLIYPRFSTTGTRVDRPTIRLSNMDDFGFLDVHQLADYFGLPVGRVVYGSQRIDITRFKAYQLIWNEFYRDQNYQDEVDIVADQQGDIYTYLRENGAPDDSSIDDIVKNLFQIRYRSWEKDYFTSALPWPQRGEEVTLGEDTRFGVTGAGSLTAPVFMNPTGTEGPSGEDGVAEINAEEMAMLLDVSDTTAGSAISVNELRRSIAIQKFREKLARSGSRYFEYLKGIFGVTPKDATLQRPEFLGGGKTPITFGEVLQTSESSDDSPLGQMAGRGIAGGTTPTFKKYFDEFGWIIGIMSVMPKPQYFQGLDKDWTYFDRFDFYTPDFDHLGEQEILQRELCFDAENPENDSLFGYTPRYAEYRFQNSRIAGDFRDSLNFWTMSRKFAVDGKPKPLNSSIIEMKPEQVSDVWAVESNKDADHLWIQMYFDVKALRPMSKYGTPLL